MQSKQLFLQKNEKKEKPSHPDYRVKARFGDEFHFVGAAWVKQDKTGKPFLNISLQEKYEDRPGYVLVQEEVEKKVVQTPDQAKVLYPDDDANPDEIPF